MNKQQRIVQLVRNAYGRALESHHQAVAERAAAIAGASAFDKYNPEDGCGGISQNPYNVNRASELEMATKTYLADMREAYDFAVDTFLETDDV